MRAPPFISPGYNRAAFGLLGGLLLFSTVLLTETIGQSKPLMRQKFAA